MPDDTEQIISYHQETKHHFQAFARGPGGLDWATQPDPFRRYSGAPVLPLEKIPPTDQPGYEEAWWIGHLSPAPLDHRSVAQLLMDSLALSAWKQVGTEKWALRVNPSSGNLHPTEGYLLCGPVDGLCDQPMVAHYAPQIHGLEQRARFSLDLWQSLTDDLPPATVLVGLTSIHWREAWKYGERAFRYCQHDAGHALATVSLAAAGLGWQAALLDGLSTEQVGTLLGVGEGLSPDVEAEHPDAVVAIYPQNEEAPPRSLPSEAAGHFAALLWQGEANRLSPQRVEWPLIEPAAAASRKPGIPSIYPTGSPAPPAPADPPGGVPQTSPAGLRRIIHQRRSAVAYDGQTTMPASTFYQILSQTLATPGHFPFNTLPWEPQLHLALFVHRVNDLDPGLYFLFRDPAQKEALTAAMKPEFAWVRPPEGPSHLELYQLLRGDARDLARQLSCQQDIAGEGCFSVGMIAAFNGPLQRWGAWFYPRLFWESGMIGQVLYLEAEAAGLRGTGIGCYFDDPVHALLGLQDNQFQSLYHFTLGGPIEDPRLSTLPPYPDQPD